MLLFIIIVFTIVISIIYSFQSFLTTDTDPGQGTDTEEQSAAATISGSGYRHASLYNLLQSEDVSTCKCPSWPQALCNGNIDVM